MPVVYFLIAIVLLAPIAMLAGALVLFRTARRMRAHTATPHQLRAWRRDRLEVPSPNRRRP